jgi:predicted  nucleic acid-binding Zn-ribbon protein
MTKKAQVLTEAKPAQGEVDRIRDIIFGPQIRDYEQRFQTLQHDLSRLQQDLDRLTGDLADQGSEQSKKLQNLRQEMRQSDDGLREELRRTAQRLTDDKVDRRMLGELFIELGKHLKAGSASLSSSDLLSQLQEQLDTE